MFFDIINLNVQSSWWWDPQSGGYEINKFKMDFLKFNEPGFETWKINLSGIQEEISVKLKQCISNWKNNEIKMLARISHLKYSHRVLRGFLSFGEK